MVKLAGLLILAVTYASAQSVEGTVADASTGAGIPGVKVELLKGGMVHTMHPGYFGLFNPSVHTAAVVADALVAAYNPQLATWRTSPAANEIERHTLAWLTAKFGLPAETVARFTSGGQEVKFCRWLLPINAVR